MKYFRQGFFTTRDGAALRFFVYGDGQPLVLCDGLGCDGFAWRYLLPELSEHYRVIHWHYRGHGESPMPPEPSGIGVDHTVSDLDQLMDFLGVPSAALFGHSMGVQVALEFHRAHARRVRGLVLLCGSYGNPLDTFHDVSVARRLFPLVNRAVERYPKVARLLARTVFKTEIAVQVGIRAELNHLHIRREDFTPYLDHLAKMDPVAFVRTLDSLREHSAWDHLPRIDTPTLVVAGSRDSFTPAWLSIRMAEHIPGAELMMISGGSHAAPLEFRDAVGRRVSRFLEQRVFPARQQRAAQALGS